MKKLLFPLLFIFLYSCSNITVTSDYDKEVDFTEYKTFSFLKWRDDNNKLINDFDKARLMKAVKAEMTDRNYTFQQSGGELAVSIYVILEDKTSYNSYTDYYGGFGYYFVPPWGWGGPARTIVTEYNYTQGTLIFNVFDAKQKKLIWQGTAIGEIDNNPANKEKNIPKVVKQTFNKYPISINK